MGFIVIILPVCKLSKNTHSMTSNTNLELHKKALEFHSRNKKGKIGIELNKKLMSKEDLALAYTPGVAIPCLEIAKNT